MTDRSGYLLGMERAEVRRLERQHRTWGGLTNKVWELASFRAGQTLVDLGSGPGFTSLELAHLVGESGRVIAVDSSSAALAQLRTVVEQKGIKNVEIIKADITGFDPSPWRPDGLFARWLFCFLEDPQAVLRSLTSNLRSGVAVAVMDYWNYLAVRTEPSSALFSKVFRAVYDSFADAGGSLDVAGELPGVFEAAGLTVTHVEPLCQVGRPGSPIWKWLAEFQEIYLPVLARKGYLTPAECETFEAWWREQGSNTVLFAPPLRCVIGVKR